MSLDTLSAPPEKAKEAFRDYEKAGIDRIRQFYQTNHRYQTVDFVLEKKARWLGFNERAIHFQFSAFWLSNVFRLKFSG